MIFKNFFPEVSRETFLFVIRLKVSFLAVQLPFRFNYGLTVLFIQFISLGACSFWRKKNQKRGGFDSPTPLKRLGDDFPETPPGLLLISLITFFVFLFNAFTFPLSLFSSAVIYLYRHHTPVQSRSTVPFMFREPLLHEGVS